MPAVVTVLRGGGAFTAEHVAGIRRMVGKHVGRVPFLCLTDDGSIPVVWRVPLRYPWPGWWAKMELFRPDFLPGEPFLFMDLDTVLVGDAAMLLEDTSTSVVLRDLYRGTRQPHAVQSALMLLRPEDRAHVWKAWSEGDVKHHMRKGGDQNFVEPLLRGRVRYFQDVYPQAVVGFKSHVRGTRGKEPPAGARVVIFHGNPRPWASGVEWAEAPFRPRFKAEGGEEEEGEW